MFQIIWSTHECHKIFNSVLLPISTALLAMCFLLIYSVKVINVHVHNIIHAYCSQIPYLGIMTTSTAATLDWCAVHGMYQIQSPNIKYYHVCNALCYVNRTACSWFTFPIFPALQYFFAAVWGAVDFDINFDITIRAKNQG